MALAVLALAVLVLALVVLVNPFDSGGAIRPARADGYVRHLIRPRSECHGPTGAVLLVHSHPTERSKEYWLGLSIGPGHAGCPHDGPSRAIDNGSQSRNWFC